MPDHLRLVGDARDGGTDRAEEALRAALASRAADVDAAPLDPDDLRAQAVRPVDLGARRRRRILLAAAAAAVVLVVPAGFLLQGGDRFSAVPGAASARSESAVARGGAPTQDDAEASDNAGTGVDSADASQGDVTASGDTGASEPVACPTAGPPVGGIVNFVAVLDWDGRTYAWAADEPVAGLGAVLGEVRCSIIEISEDGTRTVPGPWPDGTATFLPVGATIHEVPGFDPRCAVGVRFNDADTLLRAMDTPGCPSS
ncbi:hypothetical protein PCC79_15660 [Propioniciclava soli]|uniref:Uncharacterized protein n=1 Tax=Propioniciclava soli TaxID=2775081 RepID=A0ABZ3C691_9ACTN